jgi:hypothetical protein
MEGLSEYHARELDALDGVGCPVDREMFSALQGAQKALKSQAPSYETIAEHEVEPGVSIAVQMSVGPERLKGFERLRDIITAYRRAWADQYLEEYLRSRWEVPLRAVGEAYHRHAADKSRPPSVKQFAKLASPVADAWFAGDLTGVYGALALKAPEPPTRGPQLVPSEPGEFATRLFERLSGVAYAHPPPWKVDAAARERHNNTSGLAGMCVEYLQLEEALRERPPLSAFGRQRFAHRSSALAEDPDTAWATYSEAIHHVLAQTLPQLMVANDRGGPADPPAPVRTPDEEAKDVRPPAWHPDPYREEGWRWWDGERWTDLASR